jgi:8-oxo-dGTP pyrophosphatase MutT (NUDIX family)
MPCDHTSVGALIFNAQGEILMFQRGTPPWGVAGPAGHRDGDSPDDAIIKEVYEEVGLRVISAQCVAAFYIQKACRRPYEGTPYHDWRFYLTEVAGEIRPSQRETRAVRWYDAIEVLQLIKRTEDYHLLGHYTEQEWQQQPGLDLPWYRLFKEEIPLTASSSLCTHVHAGRFVSMLIEARLGKHTCFRVS